MAEEEQEDGCVWQELQVLQSIYLEELEVCREDRVKLRITLHPATGDDAERQYVCLTLQLSLPPQYPEEPPDISVSHPRGLCDEQIVSITEMLRETAAQSLGAPLLYELIEKGKEMLTACNLPRGHCVICLYGFQEGDFLTKTPCFHHFHSHCLGRYAQHSREQQLEEGGSVLCPVCRECLTCDFIKLQEAPPPQQPEERYVPDPGARRRQEEERRQIYERQRANGGIIDVEAERNRFFISIQEAPAPDPAVLSLEEESDLPANPESVDEEITSKPQAAAPVAGSKGQPGPRERRGGQHWRGGRPRLENRRAWRDEVGHRDFHPQSRGRGKTRGAQRTPVRGGSDPVTPPDEGALH